MHCWLCFCFKSNSNSAAHTTIRWLKIPCHFQDFFLHLKNFRKVLADCFPHFLRMDASAIEMAGNLIKIIADLPKFWNKFLWFRHICHKFIFCNDFSLYYLTAYVFRERQTGGFCIFWYDLVLDICEPEVDMVRVGYFWFFSYSESAVLFNDAFSDIHEEYSLYTFKKRNWNNCWRKNLAYMLNQWYCFYRWRAFFLHRRFFAG